MRAAQLYNARAILDAREVRQQHGIDAHARPAPLRRLMKLYLTIQYIIQFTIFHKITSYFDSPNFIISQ
jgi:hypothetical protein